MKAVEAASSGGEFLMSLQKNRTIFTLLSLSCLIFPAAALGQSSANTTQSASEKNQHQNSTPKNKQKNKSKSASKKGDDSRHPMDERAPIPRQPGKMDAPTLPQRTPGQQPTPGSADPTSPTTTKPQ
jgi:hypothetical protein